MKALFRILVILFATSLAVGLALDLHENRVCHLKKKVSQLEIENEGLIEEVYSLRKEFAELQKERNKWIIEATRSRKKGGIGPKKG